MNPVMCIDLLFSTMQNMHAGEREKRERDLLLFKYLVLMSLILLTDSREDCCGSVEVRILWFNPCLKMAYLLNILFET